MASGIDTVIFDMDGVIFDSEILVLQAWKEVAERHGIAGVEAACHECLGTNSVVSKQRGDGRADDVHPALLRGGRPSAPAHQRRGKAGALQLAHPPFSADVQAPGTGAVVR